MTGRRFAAASAVLPFAFPAIAAAAITAVSSSGTTLSIAGTFGTSREPVVTFAGSGVPVTAFNATSITASLPAVPNPATYPVTVQSFSGRNGVTTDFMALTVGAVGPEGPQGPAGQTGPAGAPGPRGPSDAFAAQPVDLLLGDCRPVARLSVPPGAFVVSAKLSFVGADAATAIAPQCNIVQTNDNAISGPDLDDTTQPASPNPGEADPVVRAPMGAIALHGSVTFDAGAPALLLRCCANGGAIHVKNIRLTAVQVGNLAVDTSTPP